eukprot:scaffold16252_cov54-Phaeocystis_antarctica.AAC.3
MDPFVVRLSIMFSVVFGTSPGTFHGCRAPARRSGFWQSDAQAWGACRGGGGRDSGEGVLETPFPYSFLLLRQHL